MKLKWFYWFDDQGETEADASEIMLDTPFSKEAAEEIVERRHADLDYPDSTKISVRGASENTVATYWVRAVQELSFYGLLDEKRQAT